MKTRFTSAILLLAGMFSFGVQAQTETKIKDHRTNPEVYFLQIDDVANSLELLPPPPDASSIQFMYDKARSVLRRDLPQS